MTRLVAAILVVSFLGTLAPTPARQPKKLTHLVTAELDLADDRAVHAVAFSPDGNTLAVWTGSLHFCKVTAEKVLHLGAHKVNDKATLDIKTPGRMAFTPDGKYLVFGAGDNDVRVWGMAQKAETGAGKGHLDLVSAVAVSPDGRTAASGSLDKRTILWEIGPAGGLTEEEVLRDTQAIRGLGFAKGGKVLMTVTGGVGAFRSYGLGKEGAKPGAWFQPRVAIDPHRVVANAGGSQWAVVVGEFVHLVSSTGAGAGTLGGPGGHTHPVNDVAYAADGKHLASCGQDGAVIVWDTAAKVSRYARVRGEVPFAVAVSPKTEAGTGDMALAVGLGKGKIQVVRLGYR